MYTRNLAMLTDFYEITMANGYFKKNMKDKIVYFDMFFRKIPDQGGFAIMAGLQPLIDYLNNLEFSDDDIDYLKSKKMFSDEFLEYLRNFKFECDLWAVPEGTPIFPNEPIVKVKGPIIQAQLVETMILLIVNHQSLIATKTNRIVRAAQGRPVIEFGSRRAQGADAAVVGARSAYIGGAVGTACTIAEQLYGIPAGGTMAHSWVQLFDTEYDSFKAYAETYPSKCTLLVDTYNVLKSGVPNAIKVFDEVLKPLGFRPQGIRIDSGDIAYLSKKARTMLDDAGYSDCKIVVSNSLDEDIIRDLILQDAKVDTFGVGERLITAKSEPVFGGVYKLVAVEKDGKVVPKIKVSANVEKITTPGAKKVYRLYNKENNKAIADLITLDHESIDDTKPYILFNPIHTWKRKKLDNFYAKELLVPVFKNGKQVYTSPAVNEIRDYCEKEVNRLWDEILRFENPHRYFIDLSYDLWIMKQSLLNEHSEVQLNTTFNK
ncbi:MAG: nicotinate phosphoribosyltransferase [Tissierellales bacterium]|nr:nicotinate phosphoribosyltransferase [Tissierellales bacterium]